jgi:hypothetical protein
MGLVAWLNSAATSFGLRPQASAPVMWLRRNAF